MISNLEYCTCKDLWVAMLLLLLLFENISSTFVFVAVWENPDQVNDYDQEDYPSLLYVPRTVVED